MQFEPSVANTTAWQTRSSVTEALNAIWGPLFGVPALILVVTAMPILPKYKLARSTCVLLETFCCFELCQLLCVVYETLASVFPDVLKESPFRELVSFTKSVYVYGFCPLDTCLAINRLIYVVFPDSSERLLSLPGIVLMEVYIIAVTLGFCVWSVVPCCDWTLKRNYVWSFSITKVVAKAIAFNAVTFVHMLVSCCCCLCVLIAIVRQRRRRQRLTSHHGRARQKPTRRRRASIAAAFEIRFFVQFFCVTLVWFLVVICGQMISFFPALRTNGIRCFINAMQKSRSLIETSCLLLCIGRYRKRLKMILCMRRKRLLAVAAKDERIYDGGILEMSVSPAEIRSPTGRQERVHLLSMDVGDTRVFL